MMSMSEQSETTAHTSDDMLQTLSTTFNSTCLSNAYFLTNSSSGVALTQLWCLRLIHTMKTHLNC